MPPGFNRRRSQKCLLALAWPSPPAPLPGGKGEPEFFQSPSPKLGEGFKVRAKLRAIKKDCGLLILAVGAVVMSWPQAALGQSIEPTQILDSRPLDDASDDIRVEWGNPLPADSETADPESAHPEPTDSTVDAEPAPTAEASDPVYLRPSEACPAEYETLVATLLRDLPQYANLVAARGFRPSMVHSATEANRLATPPTPSPVGTMLVASQPDFKPIDLSERAFGAGVNSDSGLRQVFFTTLERQYLSNQVVSLQQFHWLFLAQAEDGWHSVLLYSSVGGNPARDLANQRLTPPQESSQGVVGQAVRLWLRDCRAGAVVPESSPN
jgi:hypothetical protein